MKTRTVKILLRNPEATTQQAVSVQCLSCKHNRTGYLTCDAFPSGIPVEIVTAKVDHSKPFVGDNGIQFEAK